MNTIVASFPGSTILWSVTALFIVTLISPAVGQETQGFYCTPNTVQPFVVPSGG